MKNAGLYLLLLLITNVCFTSCDPCTKKVDCPAFDAGLMSGWFPYKEGDTKYFDDNSGNRDTLLISKVTQTVPHKIEYRTGTNGKEEFCDVHGSILSKKDKNHPGWLSFSFTDIQQGEYYESSVTLGVRGMGFRLAKDGLELVPAEASVNDYCTTDKHTAILLNGINYNNVLVFTVNDTAMANRYNQDKVYIAKGHGLIGYRTYAEQKEYWLQ